MKVVVIKMSGGSVGVLSPSAEALQKYSLTTLASQAADPGQPFWVVDSSEVPTDRTFRDAWEIPEEWGPPTGYGAQEFDLQKLAQAKS